MTLLRRQPREVYRAYDEDQLTDESAWLTHEPGAEQEQENSVRERPTSVSRRPRSKLVGTLLGGAAVGLIAGLLIVHGQRNQPLRTAAPGVMHISAKVGDGGRAEAHRQVIAARASAPASRDARRPRLQAPVKWQASTEPGHRVRLNPAARGSQTVIGQSVQDRPAPQAGTVGADVEFGFER